LSCAMNVFSKIFEANDSGICIACYSRIEQLVEGVLLLEAGTLPFIRFDLNERK